MNRRSRHTQARYNEAREKGETILYTDSDGHVYFDWKREQIIRQWEHWILIPNRFPYDLIFTTHDLLVPKAHVAFIRDMADEVRHEYYAIKKELDAQGEYESIIENFTNSRSVEKHFHAHLVHWRK